MIHPAFSESVKRSGGASAPSDFQTEATLPSGFRYRQLPLGTNLGVDQSVGAGHLPDERNRYV